MRRVTTLAFMILRTCGALEAMKFQKIVYYCQCWHLAIRDEELFSKEIQAWVYGPVVPFLYRLHRKQLIVTEKCFGSFPSAMPETPALVQKIIRYYGQKSGQELSDLTHSEEPWIRAREGLERKTPGSMVISKKMMSTFYRTVQPPFKVTDA